MSQQGLARSVRLFRLFLREQTDPVLFYSSVAKDAVSQVAIYGETAGKTVLDVGGGAGYFTAEFRARGADCYLFEPDPAELFGGGGTTEGAVLAAGYAACAASSPFCMLHPSARPLVWTPAFFFQQGDDWAHPAHPNNWELGLEP